MTAERETRAPWRVALGNIIFNADTPAGRAFDTVLIVTIFISVLTVMLDSVASIHRVYGPLLDGLEAVLTGIFTVEYILRLISARSAAHYARSFFGVVDLLSILPGYLSLFFPSAQFLLIVRVLRLLRIFRIFKLVRFLSEASILEEAIRASLAKIVVFIATVLTLVTIIGALMYVIEGPQNGFSDIPTSIYWAIVTLTTVGYGDISPKTGLGKGLASLAMIMGYGIIAVPTGIVTVGIANAQRARLLSSPVQNSPVPSSPSPGPACPRCGQKGHVPEARYCFRCGERLPETA